MKDSAESPLEYCRARGLPPPLPASRLLPALAALCIAPSVPCLPSHPRASAATSPVAPAPRTRVLRGLALAVTLAAAFAVWRRYGRLLKSPF